MTDRLPEGAAERETLDAIIAGAVLVVDQVTSPEPFLPQLAPADRERAGAYGARASAEATLRARTQIGSSRPRLCKNTIS